jgi:hypothetical protein
LNAGATAYDCEGVFFAQHLPPTTRGLEGELPGFSSRRILFDAKRDRESMKAFRVGKK